MFGVYDDHNKDCNGYDKRIFEPVRQGGKIENRAGKQAYEMSADDVSGLCRVGVRQGKEYKSCGAMLLTTTMFFWPSISTRINIAIPARRDCSR